MSEYIVTESGNVISKKAQIKGSKYIVLSGNTLIEGNAAINAETNSGAPVVALGKYCVLESGCVLSPPIREKKTYPLKIGNYVHVGANAHINAAQIGSCVEIGENCSVGAFAVIKSGVVLEPGAVVPPFAVVPSLTKVSGVAEQTELSEAVGGVVEMFCRKRLAGISIEPVDL